VPRARRGRLALWEKPMPQTGQFTRRTVTIMAWAFLPGELP